jgi:aminoglycoside phosphotransferase (APT) family kinase protein
MSGPGAGTGGLPARLTPPLSLLEWVSRQAGGWVVRSVEPLGLVGGSWQLWSSAEDSLYVRVGDPREESVRRRFVTEVAALTLAEAHGLAAPRVVAVDLDGRSAGQLALLRTVLPGYSGIPAKASPSRLRAFGAAAAAVAAIPAPPSAGLLPCTRPIAGNVFPATTSHSGPARRLRQAARQVAAADVPAQEPGLVHGDLWQGNLLWLGDRLSGIVDWDCAGAGSGGIDLGYLRLDAAIMYGSAAADEILRGWNGAGGCPAQHVAYWDLVAAVATPPSLREWLPSWHAQGRTDLDERTLTARRDAFVRAALRDLG